jgi:hypothetical protein
LTTESCNFFDAPSQVDFCLQQLIASTAVGITFTRESERVRVGHVFLQGAHLPLNFESHSISTILPAFFREGKDSFRDSASDGKFTAKRRY